MSDNGEKKSGGCFQQGCGVIVLIVAVVLFITQCGPALVSFIGSEPTSPPAPQTPTVVSPEASELQPPVNPPFTEDKVPLETEPQDTAIQAEAFTEAVEEPPVSDIILVRDFAWEYGSYEYTWSLKVPEAAYDYFKDLLRPPTMDYSVYITHPLDDPYIDALANKLKETCERDGLSQYQTVEMVAAFVQSLPYTLDSVTTPYDEYPRYPIETLVDEGGDCEDTSILLASILDKMDYGVVLIELPNHLALGIKGGEGAYGTYWEYAGDKYFYVETTGSGWSIGQLPDTYKDATAHIYPLLPVPIIQHDWELAEAGTQIELKVKVTNLGTATASNVYVYAGFDAGGGKGWSLKQSDTFDLEAGREVTATMYLLPPPTGQHVRLLVWIVAGGIKLDESYSAWVDT